MVIPDLPGHRHQEEFLPPRQRDSLAPQPRRDHPVTDEAEIAAASVPSNLDRGRNLDSERPSIDRPIDRGN